jgi:adenosylhomocysteine nucleosidase
MSRIAIVAALEREVGPLIRSWRVSEKEHQGRRFRFFEGDYAVVVCGGIGAEAARRATEAVIVLYAPSMVYSAGYAGALDPALKAGLVLRPLRVIQAGDGSSISLPEGQGVLVSYGQVASPQQKSKLRESFAAQAVDMEASAVARAAELRGVEFGAIKVISDEFDFDLPAMDRFVDPTGRFQEVRFALFAAVRPWLWPKVLRLARNSNRATRALCEQLRTLANSASAVVK